MKAQEAIYVLKDNGVNKIKIEYSGSGDSGAIDTISYLDKEGDEMTISEIEGLKDAVDKLAYTKLNDIEDWWNNEGGEGVMMIDLNNLVYSIVNEIRSYSYDTYNHEGGLQDLIEE